MKPVHGDTVSNDTSSSSTWCSCSNQSGLSFRRLSSLQGAKTDGILHEKYIPLKENNLLEKLVKTRVLYEELRHQILSSSLSRTSKPNLIPGKPALGVGKHILKANKSKIIELVDLVDKGVILRPEKLCECCDCNNYNSETKYKYGPKERRQRQIHTGGCLTSKSSIISKKITIGESRLEIRFKTKNIKSDPCTFKFSEFFKRKSREALTRDHGKPYFNTRRIPDKKSHHKLKRSKHHFMDAAKLSISKIKQQATKDVKNTKPIPKKTLEPIVNHCQYLKTKPCCYSDITHTTLVTDNTTKTDKRDSSCLSTKDLTSNPDVKLDKKCYKENWNYKIECPNEKYSRDNSQNAKHRIAGSFKESLPFTLDIKVKAEKHTIKKMEINLSKSCKKDTAYKHDTSAILKQNENLNIIALSQMINSKKNCPLLLQGLNTYFTTKNSLSITSSKRSIQLLSIDSTPKVDSGLFLSETKCKTFEKACLCCRAVQREHSSSKKYENSYKTKTMKSSYFTDCKNPEPIITKNTFLHHNNYSNSCEITSQKSSGPNFCSKLGQSSYLSLVENKLLLENRAINQDQLKSVMKTCRRNNNRKFKTCDESIIHTCNMPQEKHYFDRKLCENRQIRISKNLKSGSHALKRSSKLKAMNINNERKISCSTDTKSMKIKTYQICESKTPNFKKACEPFLCRSGGHDSSKLKSGKMHNPYTASELTCKSLTALKECHMLTNPLQVKISDLENCPITRNPINDIEYCWPIQYKMSKTGSYVTNTKCRLRKHCLRKCLCSFKLGTEKIEHSISKPTTFTKATMMSLDHIVVGPQTVSEFVSVNKSSLIAKSVPHYPQKRVFNNPVKKIAINNGDEIKRIPMKTTIKCRRAKSTSAFLPLSIYHLFNTKKVQSCFDTYKKDASITNCKLKEINETLQAESQKEINNDANCATIKNLFKETFLSAPDIIHKKSGYLNKDDRNVIALNEISTNSLQSRNYKLIKIQKEIYLMISPSSNYHFSTLKLEKSKDIIYNNYASKPFCIANGRKYSGEKKVTTSELLIKTSNHLHPFVYQRPVSGPQKLNVDTGLEKDRHHKIETAVQRSQSNSESNSTRESKTMPKDDTCSKIREADSIMIKHLKRILPVTDISNICNFGKNPSNQQYFGRKSSRIMSVSSTIAIKSKNMESYFQSKFNLFQVRSRHQNETFQVKSKMSCEVINRISSRKINVKASSMEHFLVMKEPCEIRPLKSGVDIDYPSQIIKPINPHLTGVSSLLTSCFCTMNIQVDGKREPRKLPYKLKPYECAPYDCVPYECDPYECQKLIIKRLTRKRSSMTSTEKNKRSSCSETSKAKRFHSSSIRRPNQPQCHCERQHLCLCPPNDDRLCKEAVCTCRSNVEFSKKKPHSQTSDNHLRNKGISNRVNKSIAHETQSNMRHMHYKSSSVSPMLKRCFCTLKLQKTEGNNRISDYQTISTSTQSTKIMSRTINRGQSTGSSNKYSGLLPYQCEPNICVPGKCDPLECLELINTRNKHAKDIHTADSGALKTSLSRLSYNMKKHTPTQRGQFIQSKYVRNKPVRSRVPKVKSKHTISTNKPSTTSARQAVKICSNFNFGVEFYKDSKKFPVSRVEKPGSRDDKIPLKEVYGQEYQVNKTKSRKQGSRNVFSQTGNFKKGSVVDSPHVTNVSSQADSLRRGQTTMTRSFLKRCFCTARLQSLKKKRLPRKACKNVCLGTHDITQLQKLGESVTILRPVTTQTRSQDCECKSSFAQSECKCLKCMCKRNSKDKGSETERYPRGLSPNRCPCPQSISKIDLKNIEPEADRRRLKSISSRTASSKTSKARSTQSMRQTTPSPKLRQVQPTLSPDTISKEQPIKSSLDRQAVRIGSNFSFDIEFHKDMLFPNDEKVQAAAEAIKSTKEKMQDVNHISWPRNKIYKSLGSSFNSLSSEINKVKGVGPMLRRCFCTLKLQDEKLNQQNNQSLHHYYSMSNSMHKGTGTPFRRPIANLHNRGVTTVYKLRTYPYKLAPHECEPGVCVPGECDPYECLKRMNRRHAGSGTDSYSTKSALSMTGPGRRYRDNRVQFSPRERRPRTREGHTRARQAPRPRNGGFEVRQKPKPTTSNRQAVKIGSNFSFNVEFYKDRSKGGSGGTYPKTSPKPCPTPCPKPCPELCPKTCPKRFMNSGTDAYSVTSRNQKAQRKQGHTRNRDSQVWGRKMRSTMTGVGPFLKRCFCTLQLQRRPQKELPHREQRYDSESSSIGTETAKYRPAANYREQGTRPKRKHRYHGRTLDPNECEPGVCVPGQCDPYVCLERIKRRRMHTKHVGTGRHKLHSVSSSVTDPYRRNRNRSVSSSMMDYRRPHRPKNTQYGHKHRRIERPIAKERNPYPHDNSAPASHRQAVRIGSSFSFNIEFYKDRNQQGAAMGPPVHPKRTERQAPRQHVRYIKRPVPVRRIRTDSTGSGPIPARTRSMSSSNRNNLRNRRMQAHSRTMLKRCFCTLKLQKIGTHQRETQESNTTVGTIYRTAGSQLRRKDEIVPQYRHFGTRTRRKRHRLEPYECEPGVCIPGQCDPYECLERIKRRHLRHSGTGMNYPHTRSMSNLTPHYHRTRSMNTPMYREPRKKYHRRYTESPRMRQPPPRPSRALENIHNRQAVRLGSSFSFNVEFYKDRANAQRKKAPCHPAICKEPDCTPLKCKTSSCSTSCPITNQRSRNVQSQGGGHDRRLQARSTRTESRGSGVPLLKRCFCTLTLQRAEVSTFNPFSASLYSQDQSTCTKNKYYEPDIPCNLNEDCEPFRRRGLRRISRTTGAYMARSRDVSGGQLGSRFMSNDTQYNVSRWRGRNAPNSESRWYGSNPQRSISRWYDRSPSERVETIVEEPRFQMFNRPNTKHTVKISSNYNFNIEFYKDIIFPDPCVCEEEEEDSDEMSAITKLQRTIYPRHRYKKSRKHFYEGDEPFSTGSYYPKFRRDKILTAREPDEYRKSTKTGKELDEHSKKMKSLKEPDDHSKKSKPEKELDERSKKTKTVKDLEEHGKKSKIEKEIDERSKKSKSEKEQDDHIKKMKSGKEIDERSKKSKSEKEQDDHIKRMKSGKEIDERSKKSKPEKEQDDHIKKMKSGKEIDERSKKSKPEKEQDVHIKKMKSGKEIDEHSKKSKMGKELDQRSKKSKSEKEQDEHGKKASIFQRLRSSKGNKCLCPSNPNNCLCSLNQNKCLCPSNQNNCLCSTNGNSKVPKGNMKYKCLCPPTEPSVKQGSYRGKKIKSIQPEKLFINKAITIARVEMGKQKSKLSIARMLPRLKSSKLYVKTEDSVITIAQTTETKKQSLPNKLTKLLELKHEHGDSKAFAADELPMIESTSRIRYLCRHNLLRSKSEQNHVTPDRSTTLLKINIETSSTKLTKVKSEKNCFISTNDSQEENVVSSSVTPESKSELSKYNSYTTISVSQSRIQSKKASEKSSTERMKSKYFYDQSPETDIVARVAAKLLKQKHKSSELLKSSELHSCKVFTSVGLKKTKNNISTSGTLLNFIYSSKLRRTKSLDGNCNGILYACPKMSMKLKPSTCNKSTCDHLKEICFCTAQMLKTKTEQCGSVVNGSRLDKIKPLSIFTPNEYWVQYQIPHSDISKRYKDKQTVTNRASKQNQTENTEIETIMAYSPRKFHESKSIMLFGDKSNHICCLFYSSNSKLPVQQNISEIRTCSTCEYHNQFCLNHIHESGDKIEPWDPLVFRFLRAISRKKKNNKPQNIVLKTSKHRVQFNTTELGSKKYKDSNKKCTYNTSFRKKLMIYRSYPRQFGNVDKVGNLINSRKTGIKFVEKSHACCRAQRKRIILHKSSNTSSHFSTSQLDEMQFLFMQSGSDNISERTLPKQDTRTSSKTSHNESHNAILVSTGFHDDTKCIHAQGNRDKFALTTDPLQRQREISSQSVETSLDVDYIPSELSNFKTSLLTTKSKDCTLSQKISNERQKPYFFYKKKCSLKCPKIKRKAGTLTGDGGPVTEFQEDSVVNNQFTKESFCESEICVAGASKQIKEAASLKGNKDMYAELQPSSEEFEKEDNLKKKQVLKNHSFIAKILICMNKLKLSSYKNLRAGRDVFDPKHAFHQLKKIRGNFGRTIKDALQKPAFKYQHYLEEIRNPNEEVLPKPLRVSQNPVDRGFNTLEISSLRSKPYYCIYCLWPRFYPHFITLVRVWRQLVDVLLFVLWSPCLFSAQLCKAFLCCFIRFRLHCYLK